MISRDELDQILGPDGPIATNHPNYEHRPGQIRMAQAVWDAIEGNRHLCVEAGTGTGKTLAYASRHFLEPAGCDLYGDKKPAGAAVFQRYPIS